MSGWTKCSPDTMPEEDQVVFWYDPTLTWPVWIGTYSDSGEEGLVPTKAYSEPDFYDGKWVADDAEWDDDYQPTHWHPLPELPKA